MTIHLRASVGLIRLMGILLLTSCIGTAANAPQQPPPQTPPPSKELLASADTGNTAAQNKLGLLYNEGQGVTQDYAQAKHWFQKAAEQGHPGAQVNLGTLYLQGHGAPESDQMALFWFRRAAEQQDALGFAKLGFMYERGRGVPQDFIQAHMWYNLSAAQGERRALESRDALASRMTPAQVAEAQRLAREWKPKPK